MIFQHAKLFDCPLSICKFFHFDQLKNGCSLLIQGCKVFLIPGKPAPRILTEDLVKLMKPSTIVYDLAAEQGGNSAFSEAGKINLVDGIKIIGVKSLMNRIPITASSLYAKNLFSFIRNLYSKENSFFNINLEDEIISKTLIKEI